MSTLRSAYETIDRKVTLYRVTAVAPDLGECAWTMRTDNTFQPSSGSR